MFAQNQTKPELKGTELCSYVFSDLKKHGCNPRSQNLVKNGLNNFPYNIFITNRTQEKPLEADNLIFVFTMEDAFENLDLIQNFAKYLKKQNFPFNTTILISYGENNRLQHRQNIYGTEAFIKTLNTDVYNIALNFDLKKEQNSYSTGAMKKSVPAWLIKFTCETFRKNSLKEKLPHFYISQLSTITYKEDRILADFLLNDIPAISASVQGDSQIKLKFLEAFCEDFEKNCRHEWDSHAIMFSIGGKYFWMSEIQIVITLIFVIFASLAFLFILSFINSSLRSQAWAELKKIWYTVPLLYVMNIGVFFLIKLIFYLNAQKLSVDASPYRMFYIQIAVSTLFAALFFMFEIRFHNKYSERSVDFMIILITFTNQFIFCLIDISLFPLFMIICLISILSIIFKNNILHAVFLVFMTLPLLPYTYNLFNSSQIDILRNVLIQNNSVPFLTALFILPVDLMCFRLIKGSKKINPYLTTGILYSATVIFTFLASITIFNTKNTIRPQKIITTPVNDNLITMTFSDKSFFGETIRTLKIDLGKEAEACTVSVSGVDSQAILYSENDYEIQAASTSYFKIPQNPPKKMTFSYGTSTDISTISVKAFYKTGENTYDERSFTIMIEEKP